MDALRNIDATPLSQIRLGQDLDDSQVIEGVVTIVWPYSLLTKSVAFILAERDPQLRRDNGQLRIEFRGAAGKAIAETNVGGGDEVRISLEGALLSELEKPIKLPGNTLEWQLVFKSRLRSILSRFDHPEPELLEVNAADDEQVQSQSLTDNETLIQFASSNAEPLSNGDAPLSPTQESSPSGNSKKRSLSMISTDEYPSPAFLKRAKLSYGSLFEDDLEKYGNRLNLRKAHRRRSLFGASPGAWRYSSRSTSPEDVEMQTKTDGEGEEDTDEAVDHPVVLNNKPRSAPRPQMVDEGCQTQEQLLSPPRHSSSLHGSGEMAGFVLDHAFRPVLQGAHGANDRANSPKPSGGDFGHNAGGESGGTWPSPPQQLYASATSQSFLPESAPVGHYRATPLTSALDAPSFHVSNTPASSYGAVPNVPRFSTTPLDSSHWSGSESNIDPSLQPSPLDPTTHTVLHELTGTDRHDLPSSLDHATSMCDARDGFATHQQQWMPVNNRIRQVSQTLKSGQAIHEECSPSSDEKISGMNPEDEQAPASEDGKDLPGEDYDLRNYDRTRDDDGESEVDPIYRSSSEAAGRDSIGRGTVDPSNNGSDKEEDFRQSSNASKAEFDAAAERKVGSIHHPDYALLTGYRRFHAKAEYDWAVQDHARHDKDEHKQETQVAIGIDYDGDGAGYNEDAVGESADEDGFDEADEEDEGESEDGEEDEGEDEGEDAVDEDDLDEDEMEDEGYEDEVCEDAQLPSATVKVSEPVFIDLLSDSEDDGAPSKGADVATSSSSKSAPPVSPTVSQSKDQKFEEPTERAAFGEGGKAEEESMATSDQQHEEASMERSRSAGQSPDITDEQAAHSATAGSGELLDGASPPAQTEELKEVESQTGHASVEAVARPSSIAPDQATSVQSPLAGKARSSSMDIDDNDASMEETLPTEPQEEKVVRELPESPRPQGDQSAGGARQQPNDPEMLEARENEEPDAEDDTRETEAQSPLDAEVRHREASEEGSVQDDTAGRVKEGENSPNSDGGSTEQDHLEEAEQRSISQGVGEEVASLADSGEPVNPPSQEHEQPEDVAVETHASTEPEEDKTEAGEDRGSLDDNDGGDDGASGHEAADDMVGHKAGRELQVLISAKPRLERESERQASESRSSSTAGAQPRKSEEREGSSEHADQDEAASEQRTSSGGRDQSQGADGSTLKRVVGSDSSKKDQTKQSTRVLRSMTDQEDVDGAATTVAPAGQASAAGEDTDGAAAQGEGAATAGSASEGGQTTSTGAAMAGPAVSEDSAAEAEDVATMKRELQKALRSSLPDFMSLHTLRFSLQKATGVLAVSTSEPPQPRRPKSGPRDYMLELTLADASIAPSGVVVAHIFRPHQASLPVVHAGDVVLLQRMQVVAVKDRGFGLRAGDASAWAVFEKGDEQFLPQIKGPPVEVSKEEVEYAQKLRKWWTMLDGQAMAKVCKATEKASQSRKGEQQ